MVVGLLIYPERFLKVGESAALQAVPSLSSLFGESCLNIGLMTTSEPAQDFRTPADVAFGGSSCGGRLAKTLSDDLYYVMDG